METVSSVLIIETKPNRMIKNKKKSEINDAIVPKNEAKKNFKNCFMIFP
jgi:hypothetical protein